MGPLVLSVVTHAIVITLLDTKMSLFGVWQELNDADAGFSISEISIQGSCPRSSLLLDNVFLVYTRMLHRLCMSLAPFHTVKLSLSSVGRGNIFKKIRQVSTSLCIPGGYFIQTFSSTLLSPCPSLLPIMPVSH